MKSKKQIEKELVIVTKKSWCDNPQVSQGMFWKAIALKWVLDEKSR